LYIKEPAKIKTFCRNNPAPGQCEGKSPANWKRENQLKKQATQLPIEKKKTPYILLTFCNKVGKKNPA